jgi:hypothetical protein
MHSRPRQLKPAAASGVLGSTRRHRPGRGAIIGGAAGASAGVATTRDRGRYDDDCWFDRTQRRYYCDRD